jgi:hypothetical protein
MPEVISQKNTQDGGRRVIKFLDDRPMRFYKFIHYYRDYFVGKPGADGVWIRPTFDSRRRHLRNKPTLSQCVLLDRLDEFRTRNRYLM